MRVAPCVRVDTPQPLRVALLKEEYAHFLADPDALATRLAHLVPLHGRKTVERWAASARAGDFDPLVRRAARRALRSDLCALDRAQLSARARAR